MRRSFVPIAGMVRKINIIRNVDSSTFLLFMFKLVLIRLKPCAL